MALKRKSRSKGGDELMARMVTTSLMPYQLSFAAEERLKDTTSFIVQRTFADHYEVFASMHKNQVMVFVNEDAPAPRMTKVQARKLADKLNGQLKVEFPKWFVAFRPTKVNGGNE